MAFGGKVWGLALERDEIQNANNSQEFRYHVVVREGSQDDRLFYTSPYLAKSLQGEVGKEINGKIIGHISYKEEKPGGRVFVPSIYPFEGIFKQKFYSHFKDRGIGTDLNIICVTDLIRSLGNVKLHIYSLTEDMSKMYSKGGLLMHIGGNAIVTAEQLLNALYKTRRKNREKHMLIRRSQRPREQHMARMNRHRQQ